MPQRIRVGVVCLARKTYDFQAAAEKYGQTRERLRALPNVEWEFIEELVIEPEDAYAAAEVLAAGHLDGLVIITGTFQLGHLALILKKRIDKPVLLWAFQEPPYDGGKIRFNSVCGLNLNASNLYKAGYDDVSTLVGDDIDLDWVDALRMKAALENARIGIVGYRADGFFNLSIDELDNFSRTGILVDYYEIAEIAAVDAPEEEIQAYLARLTEEFDCSELTEEQKERVAALCVKLRNFMERHRLTALAVRCWPEFANRYGISPCASMSILQSQGYIIGCEGDIQGAMSMLICDAVGERQTPFLADFSQVNAAENYALLWHCGVAPQNLWDGQCTRSLDTYFAGGRGVTAGFVLKPGSVNLVRIDSARGRTRLFVQRGTAVPMDKELMGTYAKVVFEQGVEQVFDTILSHGVAHHFAVIYSEKVRAFKIFAKIMGYEVIE